uniref:Secreted protein n=1 Tax=Arundo donax TaxID=35708 RepID=A0A0A9E2C7_ARUDO
MFFRSFVLTTTGLPIVSVPVLSKTMQSTLCTLSRACPPLIRTPCEAPTPVATITAVGVASPKAQGQAITITDIPN